MTTSEVLNYLRGYTTLNLSEKRMGEALRKAGFERKSRRIGGNPIYVCLSYQESLPESIYQFPLTY